MPIMVWYQLSENVFNSSLCTRILPSFRLAPLQAYIQSFLCSWCRVRQSDVAAWRPWLEDLCCGKLRCNLFLVGGHSRYSLVCLSLVLFFPVSFLYSWRRRGHALYSISSRGFLFPPTVFYFWLLSSAIKNKCSKWDHLQTRCKTETLKALYMIPRYTGWG